MNQEIVDTVLSHLTSLTNGSLFTLLWWNHCFLIANIVLNRFKKGNVPFVVGYLCCIVAGLGGSIATNLLMGKRQIFFDDDMFLGVFFIAWVCVNYVPLCSFLTNNFLSNVIELTVYVSSCLFISSLGFFNLLQSSLW
jgi:hypothetical protein